MADAELPRLTPEYLDYLWGLPNDLGAQFGVGHDLEPIPELSEPFWAQPWKYDLEVRHQAKLDKRDYKDFCAEGGISDESSEEGDRLSSLTASDAEPVDWTEHDRTMNEYIAELAAVAPLMEVAGNLLIKEAQATIEQANNRIGLLTTLTEK